ncbi:transcriptional regulator with XRE-family HTH domain [Epilithonimonas hungarica]|uniref:hypothetical protein n=1 Tax=Epilithonimonas hungarica TaxID=454006 RepID=UPI00278B5281|nr:hypothetical protein [Epilithonimonas hungarica]MDP9954752.1 transcriptional regulator with XRE-family HTH domain [Epilithonimonas hungarica]
MSIKERLKFYIKSKKGLTNHAFEKSIGVSNGYINSISKGIGGIYLERIREKYKDLDINWLLTGEEVSKINLEEFPKNISLNDDFINLPIEEKLNKIYFELQENKKSNEEIVEQNDRIIENQKLMAVMIDILMETVVDHFEIEVENKKVKQLEKIKDTFSN